MFAIQVGTPSFGNTQRMTTKYPASSASGITHSGIYGFPAATVVRTTVSISGVLSSVL